MRKVMLLFLFVFSLPTFATGISGGTSAPCDNDTLSKYSGTVNAEINWEPNTINLNWYDGDEKLTVNSNAQSCTYDGTLTVPPQPTKPGYTFNGWKVIPVPGGFTELEYIESTGTQWINTEYVYTDNTTAHIIIDTVFTNGSSDGWRSHGLSGSRYGGPNVGIAQGQFVAATNNDFKTGVSATLNTRYLFELDMINRIFLVTDVATNTILVNRNDFPNGYRNAERPVFVLFGFYEGSGVRKNSSKVYSAKLYDNNILMRNFIPAKRNSDGVLGMYDSITGQFFTNSGMGDFVAGPVVE